MKTITIFKKSVSITVMVSLLLSFVISPSTANVIINKEAVNQYNEIFDNFILPYSYGQITKAHYAGTDRVVINIQDLHCHPKVQKNISNIIETFDKSYGVNKVYLEGAYGKVDTSWINKKIQEYNMPNLLDKMLETGRLTGAEYYSALSGKNQIISGLEEKGPYLENLKRFGNIIENQEKINLILNAVEESTKELKDKYYTKKQHNIDEISQKYKEGKINTEKYYSLLSKHIDKLGIDLSRYENTLRYIMLMNLQKNLKTANITKELQSLVLSIKEKIPYDSYKKLLGYTDNFTKTDKLFSFISAMPELNINLSSNYKNLDKYFRYIELSKKVNPVELVNEEVKLTQEINTRFSQTKQQRDIVFLTSFERYLQNYLNSKITSQDYKYYSDNIAKYKELWNKYADNRVLSLLDDYIKQADSFYKTNNERNIYFANKIFENEKTNKIEDSVEAKEDINKIIGNIDKVKKLDVVITGGFHSQTVTELLESKNVSYIVITPKIAQDTKFAQDTYYQLAKEQSEINFQTLAPAIASLSPELQNKILNMVSNSSYKEEQISALNNEDRVKLISDLAAAKILESDDIGNLEEKLQEIVKDLVGDLHRDRVTPELISKIKNLQELLKDKEQLQKTIDLLDEDSVAKQSVMLVSDTFDYLDNLLDIFLKINVDISRETVHNLALQNKQNEFAEATIDYNENDRSIVLLVEKQDGTIYSVKIIKGYRVYLASINDSICNIRYENLEDIEKKIGVKINTNLNERKIVAKSNEPGTKLSFVNDDFDGISKIASSLKGIPLIKSQQQLQEVESLVKGSGSRGKEYIYLDAPFQYNKDKIRDAIYEDKLIVLYPFSNTYDIDSLTDKEIYALYSTIRENIFIMAFSLFPSDIPNLAKKEIMIMKYALQEFVKNAFVHGNMADTSKPIYIKCNKEGVSVYNAIIEDSSIDKEIQARRKSFASAAGLSGEHKGLQEIQNYEKEGFIETKREIKTQTIELDGKTKEVKYYSVTASKINKSDEQTTKTLEIDYDTNKEDQFITILITKPNKDKISIRFEPSFIGDNGLKTPSRIYLNSINNDGYSKYDANYNRADKIEELLGIKINIEPLTLTISNIPEDYDVTYVKKEDVEETVSSLKQFDFPRPTTEELEALQKVTKTEGSVFVYLDNDTEKNKQIIAKAKAENRLIVLYPFSKTYDIDSLTDEELYSLYVSVLDRFKDMAKNLFPEFPTLYSRETMDIFLHEYVKNAFVHGNSSDLSKPIYIDSSKINGGVISVYNVVEENIDADKEKDRTRRLALATAAWLTGMHVGLSIAGKMEFGLASQTVKEIDVKIGSKNRKLYLESLENLNFVAKMQKMAREQGKKAVSDIDVKSDTVGKQKISEESIELPKQFARFADDYNQLMNLDDLPSMDAFDYKKREAYQEFFEDDVFAVTNMSQKVKFDGNTKYVYILQNQRNNEALFDVLKMQNIDVNFKLFALMYLEKMSRGFSNEEKELFETLKVQVIEQFKDAVANNNFEILNNFDLRSYLTGIYLLIADFSEKENISYIANKAKFMISRALIVNPDGKTLATSDGFFAQADFFTLVHELTHVMIPKPGLSNRVAFDTIDELVSYITPNLIMKLVNFSVEAYKKISFKYYTLHYGKDSLDYVRMGSKFQALYNLFSDKTDEFVLEQDEHRSAIAFLDLLFYAHKNIGTQVSFDVLLKTITENMSNVKEVNQESMYYILLDKYFENLVKENVLSEQEVQNLKKEVEKIQLWTLMSYDIIDSIEQDSPEILKEILGLKSSALLYNQLLATPNMTKEFLENNKVAETLKTKKSLTKKDIINLLIMEVVIGKSDYETLAYNIDNVIFGIINITSDAFKLIDSTKTSYSLDDYNEIKNYFENNYSYISNMGQGNEIDISVTDNMIDFISSSIDEIFFIDNLINLVFPDDAKTLNLSSRNLVITNSSQQARTLNDLISAEDISDAVVVSMEIIKSQETDLRGGIMLDVNNGIRVKYDKSNSKLIVYSKKGVTLSEKEIKDMIVQAYYDTREEGAFEGAIAFVDSSVQSVQAMENKLKNEYTNSVVMANKETKFDISQRNVNDLATMCKQESIATGTKTFVISIQQAKMFETQIKSLQENDFKFIVVYQSYKDFDGIIYDGIKINLSSVTSVQEALDLLEKIKKESLKKGVDISISAQFNEGIYKAFEQQNINIFKRYGILPIISSDSKYVVSRNIGRIEVENITRENIDQILRNDNIASIVVDDATVICDKRAENKNIRTKEQKYNKGYKAALSSKFDYTVKDIKSMFDIIQVDFDSKTLKEQIDGFDLSLLSDDSKNYVEYLKFNKKYEEILGFIRGAVMNTVANEISSVMEMDKKTFLNDKKNKMVQAILISTIQKMMNGETIENIYKETAGSDELSAQEYLNSIRERINGDLDKVLRENEYKIVKIEPSAIADFKGIPELLSDIYGHKATVSNDVDVSIDAIKSILSAA